jgi:hypothetical protein
VWEITEWDEVESFKPNGARREVAVAEQVVARYAQGAIPGSELQEAINAALADISADPTNMAELAPYGIDEQVLRSTKLTVEQTPGVVPAAIVVGILIATGGELSADGIKALWGVVLRRVKKRKGQDAVGEEKPPEP